MNIEKMKARTARRVEIDKKIGLEKRYPTIFKRLKRIEDALVRASIRERRLREIYTLLSWERSDIKELVEHDQKVTN